jgi:hypothetical protein
MSSASQHTVNLVVTTEMLGNCGISPPVRPGGDFSEIKNDVRKGKL